MKVLRKIIEIDEELCDGCGQCAPSCAEGSLEIVDGKATVVAENLCDGLGACLGECPTGALRIVEREAEEFDEEAVEKYLETKQKAQSSEEPTLACGCPSTQIQTLAPISSCEQANRPTAIRDQDSALAHWPIKIRLVPAHAPFLKNAELLILADCCGVAYPSLHRDFLQNKVVLMGCPKFDEVPAYIDKFAEIFETAQINSVTCLIMEVPCCSGLPMMVKKGMEKADVELPVQEVVVNPKGQILKN